MHFDRRSALAAATALLTGLVGRPSGVQGRELAASPADYHRLLTGLRAGDILRLSPGTYLGGLDLRKLHGAPDRPIVIQGPPDRSARFLGRPGHNTVELRDVSYVELRNLTLDGLNTPRVDGVNAHGLSHHITLANLEILNHAAHQQTVGISTKAPAWSWIIRNNIIRGAGTGLYLGNSDGTAPFVQGLIEHNLIAETIGYGLQIKHQGVRPALPGMPSTAGSTIIRRNIISKAHQPTSGFQAPRPNLLVGHFPLLGVGSTDLYEIYGNLLYQNLVDEPLFQGEGNLAFHDNLLINHHGHGAWIQPHNDRPRNVAVFHNTIVARKAGVLLLAGDPAFRQLVMRNAVFAGEPLAGGEQHNNLMAAYADAAAHLRSPFGDWESLDLRPRRGRLREPAEDLALLARYNDSDRDFAGNSRRGEYLGAYAGPDVSQHNHWPASSSL